MKSENLDENVLKMKQNVSVTYHKIDMFMQMFAGYFEE